MLNTLDIQTPIISAKSAIIEKIKTTQAKVAIVGLGYVGLPLAVCVAKIGYSVLGVDISTKRVEQLNQGISYIDDISDIELAPFVESGLIQAYSDFDILAEADVIIICVPTPLTKNQVPDISYIKNSTEEIAKRLRPGQFISLESTTYPGTTEEVMLPILQSTGLIVGEDFFLAHSPERVDPGNQRYTTHNTNKVVGGCTPDCAEVTEAFYSRIIMDIISVSSPSSAEMVKVFENTFRAVNIALVNELAILCDKMGLNVWEVLDAASTKPFGIMTFYPGPGVGGHCIPIDPHYLSWKAREFNFYTRFIELAGEINANMPQFVRDKLIRALGKHRKPLVGSKILLLGLAYKPNIKDHRNSPAVDLLDLLQQEQAQVFYNDPFVPTFKDSQGQLMASSDLTPEFLASLDCVVITTNHDLYTIDFIVEHSPLILDTRNATRNIDDNREKIILL